MIFVNTRHGARRIVEELRRHGHSARALTGNVVQTKRLRVLDDFRDGRLPILVATDVASRGLHIEGVSHVINWDLPQDAEDYVHRIGRTARVGARGKAISLACEDYVYSLDAIQKFVGYEIPTSFAGDELFLPVLPPEERKRSGNRRRRSRGRRPGDDARASRSESGDGTRRRRRRRRPKPRRTGGSGDQKQ
jgi:ATP-dependent RNA helicase RhlB